MIVAQRDSGQGEKGCWCAVESLRRGAKGWEVPMRGQMPNARKNVGSAAEGETGEKQEGGGRLER